MEIKICSKCKKELPATQKYFYHDNKGKNGLRSFCKKCQSIVDKARYIKNRNRFCEKYVKNRDILLKKARDYRQKNKERIRLRKFIYNRTERARAIYKKANRKRYRNNRLSCCISSMVRSVLRGNKAGESWRFFVSYSAKELAVHLQGTIGLTNKVVLGSFWKYFYGEYYQIDHIRPISSFNKIKLQDVQSDDFKSCWALENLRLLSPEENFRKGKKILDNE